ncbi:hypothetical protein PIB30_116581 [Stylosanthes scabra]|uniref:GTD-binding domain-containing protein n=1 Tax=Stylosanthes scabra TaxID=79078 RepID=A0ABU6Q4Y1_9FABA|nr:hypothetical protein [Stylosanthes scabra]
MFAFCFKFLRFAWYAKNHFRFFCDSGGIPRYRIILDAPPLPQPPPKSKPDVIDPSQSPSIAALSPSKKARPYSEEASENESLIVDEDDVFDIISLRRLVKMERRKANAAWSDLEKERTAAASSAEEAMAMILRLQNEKSSAEIESNQFRRMADERQGYEQELIEELQWTINQHEIEKNVLEEQIGSYKEELKLYITEEELRELERELELEFGFDNNDVGPPPPELNKHEPPKPDANDNNTRGVHVGDNYGNVDENSDRGSVIIADDDDDDYDGRSVIVADDDDGGSVVADDDHAGSFVADDDYGGSVDVADDGDGGSVVADDDRGGSVVSDDDRGGSVAADGDDHGGSVVADGDDRGGSVVADDDRGGSVVSDGDDRGGSVVADDDRGGSVVSDDDRGGSVVADGDDRGGSVVSDDDRGGSVVADGDDRGGSIVADDDDRGDSVVADDEHGGSFADDDRGDSVVADDDHGGSVVADDDDPEPDDRSDNSLVSSPKTQSQDL